MKTGNFVNALQRVTEYWSPAVIGQCNDQYVKVAKLKGQFVWHQHDEEDELFYVVKGSLVIDYEDGSVHLNEGDFHIVPKGKRHKPHASEECHVVLIETMTTQHTGDVVVEQTRSIEEQLDAN